MQSVLFFPTVPVYKIILIKHIVQQYLTITTNNR